MPPIKRKLSKSEKLKIVKLSLEENQSIKFLAEQFDTTTNSIYKWRKMFLEYKENAFPGKGKKLMTESEKKIAALKNEIKKVKLESEKIKKTMKIFSKSNKK